MSERPVWLAGLAIVSCFLAWNGTLQQTVETAYEAVEAVFEARETVLSELEMLRSGTKSNSYRWKTRRF